MSTLTMAFIPGTRYQFRPRPGKYTQTPGAVAVHTKTLTYLRDDPGDWNTTGRVTHHLFQLKGGALESFTDWQMSDYVITKRS